MAGVRDRAEGQGLRDHRYRSRFRCVSFVPLTVTGAIDCDHYRGNNWIR